MTIDLSQSTILIVDDTPANIRILEKTLGSRYTVAVALSGAKALQYVGRKLPELILLDILMPDIDGFDICVRLKGNERTEKIPIIMVTALTDVKDITRGFELGAVDYIRKPFEINEVLSRVQTHLELKFYRDRLEEKVKSRTKELRQSLNNLNHALSQLDEAHVQIKDGYREAIFRLTLASEYKDEDTGEHIKRVSYYTSTLAETIGMDREFQDIIYHASPMHDIGKVAIPDNIILKPGLLAIDEWEIMKTHTTIGAKILENSRSPYLQMAWEIALSHHEKWDGKGFPVGLKEEQIPMSARIMNLADQYDALRSKRPYKPALGHEKVYEILTKGDGRTMPEHFDPQVLQAFIKSSRKFKDIFWMMKNPEVVPMGHPLAIS